MTVVCVVFLGVKFRIYCETRHNVKIPELVILNIVWVHYGDAGTRPNPQVG